MSQRPDDIDSLLTDLDRLAIERAEHGEEVLPDWAVDKVRALLSSLDGNTSDNAASTLTSTSQKAASSISAAPLSILPSNATSLNSSEFKSMLLNLKQTALAEPPQPIRASSPVKRVNDQSKLNYVDQGHLQLLSQSSKFEYNGSQRPTLREFVVNVAHAPAPVQTHLHSQSLETPFRPGGGNAAMALASRSFSNLKSDLMHLSADHTFDASKTSKPLHSTRQSTSTPMSQMQPRIFVKAAPRPSSAQPTPRASYKAPSSVRQSVQKTAKTPAATDSTTSVGDMLAASGYNMNLALRHGAASAFPFSFDPNIRSQVDAHLAGVSPMDFADLEGARTMSSSDAPLTSAEAARVQAISSSHPQSRTKLVPPGYRVVYFPHVDGAQYCQGEFHEVLLSGDMPVIVHPCYIRDANAPKVAPMPRNVHVGHETESQLRHRIAELEALLAFERERQRILLSELQSAHHHELLLQAQIKMLEERIEELLNRIGDANAKSWERPMSPNRYASMSELQRYQLDLRQAQNELAALRAKLAELEKALKAAQDAQAAQLAVNKALQEEFRRYRAQHAQGKLELVNSNRQLNAALKDLLENHDRVRGELDSERAVNRMMKERLDQQPPELTIFQRLRVLVNAALLRFFQKRYREEKKRRIDVEKQLRELRDSTAHLRGNAEGRLAAEMAARERAEARVKELEQRLDGMGALTAMVTTLRRDVADAQREKSELSQRLRELELENQRLRNELDAWKIGNSTRDTKYNELREERDQLLARMANMSDSTSGTELSAAEQDLKSPAMLHWIAMVRESFEGDYGGASRHAAVLQAMFGSGDEPHTLVFCDMVKKVGRNAVNDRLLLVAGVHLQLLEPDASASRCIMIADIEFVSMSRLHSEVLVIHHKTGRDMLLLVPKRTELLFFLIRSYFRITGQKLPYRHAERLYVRDQGDVQREIEVFAPNQYRVGKSVLMAH